MSCDAKAKKHIDITAYQKVMKQMIVDIMQPSEQLQTIIDTLISEKEISHALENKYNTQMLEMIDDNLNPVFHVIELYYSEWVQETTLIFIVLSLLKMEIRGVAIYTIITMILLKDLTYRIKSTMRSECFLMIMKNLWSIKN